MRRIPGIELSDDKATVLENLDQVHREARRAVGLIDRKFVSARQVHGDNIAVVDSVPAGDTCFEGCDGVITNQRGVCLGVYVADCCAIFLVDQNARAIGLVHSGKKGTALGIASRAIELMWQ
ncbi:MAG TPA: laccase domain-containing protein, partial [Chthoniobacterales bacterium]|nr:laccase domain-containing protein [Chthoniobacterales bacterium]